MHTGGEPVRIPACAGTVAGYPPIAGATLRAKRRQTRERLDEFRRLLMSRPSGQLDMCGVIPVAPDPPRAGEPAADLAVLFMRNEGCSTRGDSQECAATPSSRSAAGPVPGPDTGIGGLVPLRAPETPVAIQCPCGLVRARVQIENGKAGALSGGMR